MNILFTSAGRRNYLLEYFREAIRGEGSVLAVDADANAPALRAADRSFVVPSFSDPGYIEVLKELCLRESVKLVVSLNDLELPLLARHRGEFAAAGVTLLVSDFKVVHRCLDKWETHCLLTRARIDTPATFLSLFQARKALRSGLVSFPLIVKPRWGTGSLGVQTVHADDELEWAYRLLARRIPGTVIGGVSQADAERAVIVQEAIRGPEFGLDVVNDLQGRYVVTLARRKLGMRAGETDKAEIVRDERLEELGEKIGRLTGHIGLMDCDAMLDEATGRLVVLELNPRFGGGYPFCHVAGANVPAAIVSWVKGREPDSEWLRVQEGVVAAKYNRLILVEPSGSWQQAPSLGSEMGWELQA